MRQKLLGQVLENDTEIVNEIPGTSIDSGRIAGRYTQTLIYFNVLLLVVKLIKKYLCSAISFNCLNSITFFLF
jgi:hypothetical protein